jgi:pimeloyl-ACP methyl ester carboxylesterase
MIAAVAEIQRLTGVTQVCLLGIRLGALLACLASKRCQSISSLILIAPVIAGARYVRELRTIEFAASLRPKPPRLPDDVDAADDRAGAVAMELCGFALSHATIEALKGLDMAGFGATSVRDIMVIDGDRSPKAHEWATGLSALGMRTKYLALPGLIEMTMTPPLAAAVPRGMVAAMRDWLTGLLRARSKQPAAAADLGIAASSVRCKVMQWSERQVAGSPSLTERPVFISSDVRLFGIATAAADSKNVRGAVIMLNTGADYHVGPNRMYVSLARRWAREGFVVLRLDIAGLGDSDTRPDSKVDEVFPPAALKDINRAVNFMRQEFGATDVTLIGVCSGGYHALRAAVAELPVNRIFMVNPENYFWNEGQSLQAVQLAEVVRSPGTYVKQFGSYQAWKLLLTGKVDMSRMGTIYWRRVVLQAQWLLRFLARKLRMPLANNLGSELEKLTKRGVRIVFVFARGEPGAALLRLQSGFSAKWLDAHLHFHVIDGGDHIFSQREPRAAMEKVLSEELLAGI